MIEQAWTAAANDSDRHIAAMLGECFVGASWTFGDVVEMSGDAVTAPGIASDSVAQARFANDAVEN